MRRLLHLGVLIALLFTFAQAPLLHAHHGPGGEETLGPSHNHGGGVLHLHWSQPTPGGPAIGSASGLDEGAGVHWLDEDGLSSERLASEVPVATLLPLPAVTRQAIAADTAPPPKKLRRQGTRPRSPPV